MCGGRERHAAGEENEEKKERVVSRERRAVITGPSAGFVGVPGNGQGSWMVRRRRRCCYRFGRPMRNIDRDVNGVRHGSD